VEGKVKFSVSDEDSPLCHLLLSGKFNHMRELDEVSLRPPAGYAGVAQKAAKYRDYLTPVKPARSRVSAGDGKRKGEE
jgi:hypothetical protein